MEKEMQLASPRLAVSHALKALEVVPIHAMQARSLEASLNFRLTDYDPFAMQDSVIPLNVDGVSAASSFKSTTRGKAFKTHGDFGGGSLETKPKIPRRGRRTLEKMLNGMAYESDIRTAPDTGTQPENEDSQMLASWDNSVQEPFSTSSGGDRTFGEGLTSSIGGGVPFPLGGRPNFMTPLLGMHPNTRHSSQQLLERVDSHGGLESKVKLLSKYMVPTVPTFVVDAAFVSPDDPDPASLQEPRASGATSTQPARFTNDQIRDYLLSDTIVQQSYQQKQDAAVAAAVARTRKEEREKQESNIDDVKNVWLAMNGDLKQKLNAALQANEDLEHKHAETISLLNVGHRRAMANASPQKYLENGTSHLRPLTNVDIAQVLRTDPGSAELFNQLAKEELHKYRIKLKKQYQDILKDITREASRQVPKEVYEFNADMPQVEDYSGPGSSFFPAPEDVPAHAHARYPIPPEDLTARARHHNVPVPASGEVAIKDIPSGARNPYAPSPQAMAPLKGLGTIGASCVPTGPRLKTSQDTLRSQAHSQARSPHNASPQNKGKTSTAAPCNNDPPSKLEDVRSGPDAHNHAAAGKEIEEKKAAAYDAMVKSGVIRDFVKDRLGGAVRSAEQKAGYYDQLVKAGAAKRIY